MIDYLKIRLIFFFLFVWNIYVRFLLRFKKESHLKYKKKFKILFVKPYDYLNLYTFKRSNYIKTILSSLYRLGPVGLFTEYNCDFIISKKNYKKNYIEKDKSRKKKLSLQSKKAQNLQNINFDKFDIVVVFEDAVCHSLIKKYTKTLWGIIYEDHSNNNYKKSIFFAPNQYDMILNQTLGYTPYSIFRRNYWIDFSYTFGNSNFLKKCNLKKSKNLDIIVEVNQKKYVKDKIKKNKKYKKIILDETLDFKKYLKTLSRGKFFLAVDCTKPRWGNSLLEAALCQNLIIGNKYHFWNSQIILEELHVQNLEDAIKLVDKLKNDKNLYKKLLVEQNKLIDYLNFTRPINQIKNFSQKVDRNLNIKKNL